MGRLKINIKREWGSEIESIYLGKQMDKTDRNKDQWEGERNNTEMKKGSKDPCNDVAYGLACFACCQ